MLSQPISRRMFRCWSVSTPSATTLMVRLCAISMMARVMAASSGLSARSVMKVRSIFSVSTGNRFK